MNDGECSAFLVSVSPETLQRFWSPWRNKMPLRKLRAELGEKVEWRSEGDAKLQHLRGFADSRSPEEKSNCSRAYVTVVVGGSAGDGHRSKGSVRCLRTVWWFGKVLYKGCMNKYKAYFSVCRSKKGSMKRLEAKRVQWRDEAYLIAIVLQSISSPLWWWCAADIASKEGGKEERKKGREGERKERKEKGRRERKEEGKEGRRERRRKDEGKSSSPRSRNIYIYIYMNIVYHTLSHMQHRHICVYMIFAYRRSPYQAVNHACVLRSACSNLSDMKGIERRTESSLSNTSSIFSFWHTWRT